MIFAIPKGGTVMKTISIFLALINSLLAGLLIAYSISGSEIRQAAAWWSLTKILAGLSVIVVGLITWLGSIRTVRPGFMALGSPFLVALGAATIVWTLHLALVAVTSEYYMIAYGQFGFPGITLLLDIVQDRKCIHHPIQLTLTPQVALPFTGVISEKQK
jgi:hypothetical protein